jgi:hypothetical protein
MGMDRAHDRSFRRSSPRPIGISSARVRTLGRMGSASYENPSDAELLRSARNGDVAAVGALIELHQAGMRAVALSVLGNRPDAEDAVQDASLIVLRHISDVRQPELYLLAAETDPGRSSTGTPCATGSRRRSTNCLPPCA